MQFKFATILIENKAKSKRVASIKDNSDITGSAKTKSPLKAGLSVIT